MTTFLSERLWKAIHQVHKEKGVHWVAVPYVGKGAVKRFPMQRGDVLITRFDELTIRSGQVHPGEILKYLRRGVEVHESRNLHAKVYVSRRHVVVGSANLSGTSERQLAEAGVASSDPALVRSAIRFVKGLRGLPIGPDQARHMLTLYRPPKLDRGLRKRDNSPRLWVVGLTTGEDDEVTAAARKEAISRARVRLATPELFGLEDLRYSADWLVKRGDWVLQYVRDGRQSFVEAPARVNTVHRYKTRRGAAGLIVVVEARKRLRIRTTRQVAALVRRKGHLIRRPKRHYLVRVAGMKQAILGLWPGVAVAS